jgi:histidyl-tRNA synthetase
MLIAEPPPPPRPVAVVPIGEAAEIAALMIAEGLRRHGHSADLGYSGNLTRRMRRAARVNARAAVLIGENEIALNVVTLRDLDSGEQIEVLTDLERLPMDVSLDELRARLRALYAER